MEYNIIILLTCQMVKMLSFVFVVFYLFIKTVVYQFEVFVILIKYNFMIIKKINIIL